MTGQVAVQQSRVQVPRNGGAEILRTRLFRTLDQCWDSPSRPQALLLSAPAGYGKTSLLSAWIRLRELPAAWLSLEASDSEFTQFAAYVTAALRSLDSTLADELQQELGAAGSGDTAAIATLLLNQLSNLPYRLALVLDNFHQAHSPEVLDFLRLLLTRLPEKLFLIAAGRNAQQLPWAVLRAEGRLLELRAGQLRFSQEELAEYLDELHGLQLEPAVQDQILKKTYGWPMGVQLAALQAERSGSSSDPIPAAGPALYFDYFAEQVLQGLPDELQSFLVRTSILDQLSPSLCQAVAEVDQPTEFLDRLERENLFTTAIDPGRNRYRYHPLFAEFLGARLERLDANQVAELHRRASEWYWVHGHAEPAVQHAFKANDPSYAAKLVSRLAQSMLSSGQTPLLKKWLDRLPRSVVARRPNLAITRAWAAVLTHESDQAVESRLAVVEQRVAELESAQLADRPDIDFMLGMVACIRLVLAGLKNDLEAIQHYAVEARQGFGERATAPAEEVIETYVGAAFRMSGEVRASLAPYQRAVVAGRARGQYLAYNTAVYYLAESYAELGELDEACALLEEAIRYAATQSSGGLEGRLHAELGGLLREQGKLEAAEAMIRSGLELLERTESKALRCEALLELARLCHSKGDRVAAMAAATAAAESARQLNTNDFLELAAAIQLRLDLGDLTRSKLRRWQEAHAAEPHADPELQLEPMVLSLARAHIATGQPKLASEYLPRWRRLAQQQGRLRSEIECLLVEAMAAQAQSNEGRAIDRIRRAVALARPHGFLRIFLDDGRPMVRLLRMLAASARPALDPLDASYVQQLLESNGGAEPAAVPSEAAPLRSAPIDPLSTRELDVLVLLAGGSSNRQIASQLGIAESTTKWHTANIYRKLGVHNRTQAARRASHLGLLPT